MIFTATETGNEYDLPVPVNFWILREVEYPRQQPWNEAEPVTRKTEIYKLPPTKFGYLGYVGFADSCQSAINMLSAEKVSEGE